MRETRFLKLLTEHFNRDCKLESLELLNFYSFTVPTLNLFSPIFAKFKVLSLTHIALPITIPYMIRKWPNLRELNLNYCHKADYRTIPNRRIIDYPLNFTSDLKKTYAHTKLILIYFTTHGTRPKNILLAIHPTLYGESVSLKINFLSAIMNATPRTLTTLKVDLEFTNLTRFLEAVTNNLPRLQTLDVNYAHFEQASVREFRKFLELKRLRLYSIHRLKGKHVTPIVRALPRLTELNLHCKINIRILLEIIRSCPKLVRLNVEIHSKNRLSETDISKIVNILQKQQRQRPLKIGIYNHDYEPTTTSEMLLLGRTNENPLINVARWP